MCLGYEVIDFALVMVQEWLDVFLVEEICALRTRQNEVKMCEKADPRIEGDPGEDEVESVLNRVEEEESDEVNEPRCELGGIGGVESFVGSEDWKKDGDRDAGGSLVSLEVLWDAASELLEAIVAVRKYP